jgi:hypothetical protein
VSFCFSCAFLLGRLGMCTWWWSVLLKFFLCMSSDQSHFASSFDHTIGIIVGFIKNGWQSVQEMTDATAEEVKEVINDFATDQDVSLKLAKALLEIAAAIRDKHHGYVPQTKVGLKSIGLREPLISLLMQQAYASSELVITLNTRKTLVALDMVDWEEFGAESKSEILMGKVTPDKVKRSLQTWLPKGERVHFYDTMDSVGGLISARTAGDWGKINKIIASHFSNSEKEALIDMANTIFQFSKTTRASANSRGKKNAQRNAEVDDEEDSD